MDRAPFCVMLDNMVSFSCVYLHPNYLLGGFCRTNLIIEGGFFGPITVYRLNIHKLICPTKKRNTIDKIA